MADRKYGDADGYDRYMGGWSALLSPRFLDFAGREGTSEVLDVGCGTGNLLVAVAAEHPGARLTGVDPSAALLAKARMRPELSQASLVAGGAGALPFADGRFSHTLSMLVLQEFPDPDGALAQMRRVTQAGGVVAACQWDFARMPVIDAVVAAVGSVDAEAGARLDRRGSPVFGEESELSDCWTRAGLAEVRAGRIAVTRRFANFDELWAQLLAGSTPSTLALASLPEADRVRAREHMLARLAVADASEPLTLTAEALVVAGRA
jgi:SAM-dependent methyltransferase